MNQQSKGSEAKGRISTKILKYGPIDNGETVLTGFWERSREFSEKAKVRDISERIISLVKKAKDTIVIYTPKLLHPELMLELESSHQRGVRIYSLTSKLSIHSESFAFGIMRERRDIESTFIVIDPKKKEKGIWFVGELASRSNPQLFLELDSEQAKEACAHFSYLFWRSGGQELFFGRAKPIAKMVDRKPTIPNEITHSLRHGGLESLNRHDISHLCLPLPLSEDFEVMNLLAEDLCVEMSEHAKNILPGIDLEWTKVKATKKLPFGYAEFKNRDKTRHLAFGWDFGFFLNERQIALINDKYPSGVWLFHPEKKLREIENKIVLADSNWEDPVGVQIEDYEKIILDDIQCDTIEEWLAGKPEPVIPSEIRLLRTIEYQWTLIPPYRPGGSKKHRLYQNWDGFDKALGKKIDSLLKKIEQTLAKKKDLDVKKTRMLVLTTKWKDQVDELKQIKLDDWRYKRDTNDVKRMLERINDLEAAFKESITGIKAKKADKKKEKPNELAGFLGLNDSRNSEVRIPHDTLPVNEVLYEKGNNTYLEVSDISVIEQAKSIAKRYHAKIVAEKGD